MDNELKSAIIICTVIAILLMILVSPIIHYALFEMQHNEDMYQPAYNPATGKVEPMPVSLVIRVFAAAIFCLPSLFLLVAGPVFMLAVPNVTNKASDFLFKG